MDRCPVHPPLPCSRSTCHATVIPLRRDPIRIRHLATFVHKYWLEMNVATCSIPASKESILLIFVLHLRWRRGIAGFFYKITCVVGYPEHSLKVEQLVIQRVSAFSPPSPTPPPVPFHKQNKTRELTNSITPKNRFPGTWTGDFKNMTDGALLLRVVIYGAAVHLHRWVMERLVFLCNRAAGAERKRSVCRRILSVGTCCLRPTGLFST